MINSDGAEQPGSVDDPVVNPLRVQASGQNNPVLRTLPVVNPHSRVDGRCRMQGPDLRVTEDAARCRELYQPEFFEDAPLSGHGPGVDSECRCCGVASGSAACPGVVVAGCDEAGRYLVGGVGDPAYPAGLGLVDDIGGCGECDGGAVTTGGCLGVVAQRRCVGDNT